MLLSAVRSHHREACRGVASPAAGVTTTMQTSSACRPGPLNRTQVGGATSLSRLASQSSRQPWRTTALRAQPYTRNDDAGWFTDDEDEGQYQVGARLNTRATALYSQTSPRKQNKKTEVPALHNTPEDGPTQAATLPQSVTREYDYYTAGSQASGVLPAEFHHGTLLSCGPGLYQRWEHTVDSGEDADGVVTSLAFREGQPVFYRSSLVRTNVFKMEQAAQRRLARGFHDKGLFTGSSPLHGWISNPLDLSFPGRANAGVLFWDNKLYALSEHAPAWELRPHSLAVVGMSVIGKQPPTTVSQKAPPPSLCGRYHVVPGKAGQEPTLVLMHTAQVGLDTLVTLTEVEADGRVLRTQQHKLPNTVSRMVRDFVVTDTRIAVIAPPVNFNLGRFTMKYITGQCSFADCMDWDPTRPAQLHVLPRHPASPQGQVEPCVVDLPPVAVASTVNGYDLQNGRYLVLDVMATQGLPYLDTTHPVTGKHAGRVKPELTRIVVECGPAGQARLAHAGVLSHRSAAHMAVAPHVVGQQHNVLYATASARDDPERWGPAKVLTQLAIRTDSQGRPQGTHSTVWSPGHGTVLGPLTLVPKTSAGREEDVWVVCTAHKPGGGASTSSVLILDGADIAAGPVWQMSLPGAATGGRVTWTDTYLGPTSVANARTPKTAALAS